MRYNADGQPIPRPIVDFLKSATSVVLPLLTLWGIGWSFYRHGPVHGVASIFIPPYAWYRGVAAIWEPPKWKEQWDENTELIGALLLTVSDKDRQIDAVKYKDQTRRWIAEIPRVERERLRSATNALGDAIRQWQRNFAEDMLYGQKVRPLNDPTIVVFVERFKAIPGLLSAWKRLEAEEPALRASLQASLDTATQDQRLEIGQRREAVLATVEGNTRQINDLIDQLFSGKPI